MAFSSKKLYTGDGSITQYNVPFPYISATHVEVYVNQTLQLNPSNYTLSSSTVTFSDAPDDGAAIEIKRNTSPTTILVDFVDGSVLNASDLDTAYLHNYYLLQETTDSFNEVINEALVGVATGAGIVEVETNEVIAALVNEMLADASAATLQQRVTDIDANAESILQIGNDLQVQINILAQGTAAVVYIQDDEPVPGVDGIPDPILDGARWYDSNDSNKPYIYDQATTTWLSLEDPRIGQAASDITVLQTDVSDNAAAVVTEQLARSTADSAMAVDLALLGAANGGDTAYVLDLTTVQIGEGETLGTRFTTITADKDANAAAVVTEQTARSDGDAAEASARATLAARVTTNEGDISSANIDISSNVTAITGNDGDIVTLYAKYGVTLDVDGYITGFAQNNDGSTGSFVVLADNFAVVTPSTQWAGITDYVLGQNVRPIISLGRVFECTTAGTSGASEPSWDVVIGNTTADGTVVWTCRDDSALYPFTVSGDKITLQGDVEINGSLLLNGTVVGAALVAGTIGSTQIGANAITTTQLNASAVTAAKIAANAVTAGKINVTSLAAMSADLGSITAGDITLDNTGYIKGGQSAYNTGSGFFLGYETDAYKFSIGDGGSSNFITWDGTSLVVRGNISIGLYTASDVIMLSALTERSTIDTSTWQEVKKFELNRPGTVRVVLDRKVASTSGGVITASSARVLLDGSVKTTFTFTNTTYASSSYDLTVGTGQYVTIEILSGERDPTEPVPMGSYIQNVYIKADKSDGEAVITD